MSHAAFGGAGGLPGVGQNREKDRQLQDIDNSLLRRGKKGIVCYNNDGEKRHIC